MISQELEAYRGCSLREGCVALLIRMMQPNLCGSIEFEICLTPGGWLITRATHLVLCPFPYLACHA